jgi:putative oxidoreductase
MTFSKITTNLLINNNATLLNSSFLILRFLLGMILFIVGSGKVFGWFCGFGMTATIRGYSQMGFSTFLTYLSSYTEFIGGLFITFGFLTRPACIAVIINMIVATKVMLPNGFLGPSGASYPFVFLIIAISILIAGPMGYSIDNLLIKMNHK